MSSINLLGISAFYHDSAACLVRDGEIIAAAQEERFSRKKGDADIPVSSVQYCLREGKIKRKDLTAVVFYDKPILKFDRILASYIHRAPRGVGSFVQALPLWLKTKLWVEDLIRKELKFEGKVLFSEHHQAHAASAFYPSPFNEAAVLTVDGAGEWMTTAIGHGNKNSLRMIKKINFPHSIGLLYSAFTYYCGFKVNSGEYKLMGLAPYGVPRYLDMIRNQLVKESEDGSYILNEKYFNYISGLKMINARFEKLFGRKALPQGGKPDQFYMDIASSVQAFTDGIMVRMAKEAKKETSSENLCIAGGVGLNCVANSRVLKEAGFKNVWVQPAAGDAGAAVGAALYAYYSYYQKERIADEKKDTMRSSLLGPDYNDEEIREVLDARSAKYIKMNETEVIGLAARELSGQKVVGWFQGRMEFGPRALGNRSILGDPRSEKMQSEMNLKVKFRESFRPFAPAILSEKTTQYFDWDRASPYMLFVADVKKDRRLTADIAGKTGLDLLKVKRSQIPAVTHVDHSARLQTVSAEDNPLFYRLLTEFEKLTGCPLLVNTSFNVRGEPIVATPADAYRCFMGTNIDILIIGNYVMYKDRQPENREYTKWKKSLVQD